MGQFVKKPIVIEAITFAELMEHARNSGANIVDNEPWSFQYKGHAITHQERGVYIIPTLEGDYRMTPDDVLITGIKGEIYPCKLDIFQETYDAVDVFNQPTIEEPTGNREFTFGEKLIGVNFNVTNDPKVQRAKLIAAELVDMVNEKRLENVAEGTDSGINKIIVDHAIGNTIDAAMSVVKVITFKK